MKVFEPFRLDTANHSLWRHEERLQLTPKAFDVLRYLVDHSDRLVTQEELLEALWPETYVNPEGIRKYILEVRKALGDRPDRAEFIKTLPKRGYQFIAPVTEERPRPRLREQIEMDGAVVGRDAALIQLHGHFDKALAGQRQVLFVTGEAGIGKTTLIDVFQQQAIRHPNLVVARGQCIEGFGGKEAYYPMLEALGSLLRLAPDGTFVQTLAKQAPTWLAQFPSLLQADQRESLQREILGSTRGRMVREICEALEAMSAQTPVMVILEDLHWVDPSTLDLISALARRRDPAQLLLIGTYRPVDVVLSQSPLKALKQDLLVRDLCQEIAIERLGESDVADYLFKEFANNSFPAGLANLIHHNSGGNPLFMGAIVREIVKKDLIVQDLGQWTLRAPLSEVYPGIPETLQQMLEIQFEQLSVEEQRILESCSVAGERFSAWAAGLMVGVAADSMEAICERLAQRKQFIRFAGIHEAANGSETAHYEFRHSLYRQALYRRLSSASRLKLHRNLSEGLMPLCEAGKRELASEAALHFEEGRDYERAARYWMLTAENATRRFSHRDAIQILRRALELVPELPPGTGVELEIQILQRIGDLQHTLGEMSDASASYQAAADRAAACGLKKAHVGALIRLAYPTWFVDTVRGNEVSRQALELCGSVDDRLLAAQARLTAASNRLLYDEWRDEDAEACAPAQETIRRLSGSTIVHDVYYIYLRALQGARQEAAQQADALIQATTNPITHVLAQGAKGVNCILGGRFGEVLQLVRRGRELAEKNGEDPWMYIFGDAWLRVVCFDFDGVSRLSTIVMRSDSEPHAAWIRTVSRISAGNAALHQGRPGEALECLSPVRNPEITPKFFLHWHWRLHAQLGITEAQLLSGNLAKARREADLVLESAGSIAEPHMQALAWEIQARVTRAGNDRAAARECIRTALGIVDRFEIPVAAWQVHQTAGDLSAEEGDRETAGSHRARAQQIVMGLADSFEPGELLRESYLNAPPVRRIFGIAASA